MRKLEIITIKDSKYPKQLKNIKNPPKMIYAEGNIELLNSNIISIIGSRVCSENGIELTQKFAKDLVYQDITIASGMAVGIDTVAHKATLQEKGKTIAVLGNGLKNIFPKENIDLFHKIINQGGLVISEYPPKEKANSNHFLERNRIVSGISLGVLVIEAAHRSGTSVTAKLALEQGKKIFAIPHEIHDLHGVGTNRLIKKGAKIVTTTEDIINEFPFLTYKTPPKNGLRKLEQNLISERKKCTNKKYNEIYKFIKEKPISLEEIYQRSNKEVSEINQILLILELEGYIEKVVGGYKCILEKK